MKPTLHIHVSKSTCKGEDRTAVFPDMFWCPDSWSVADDDDPVGIHFSYMAVFDGHGGKNAAEMASKSLLEKCLLTALDRAADNDPPVDLDAWWKEKLPGALRNSFLYMDRLIKAGGEKSGCTASVAVLSGRLLATATVGDSHVVVDTGTQVVRVSAEHRIEDSKAEQERIRSVGGKVARSRHSREDGGAVMGPMRVWPGGLAISRSLGDVHAQAGGVIAEPEVSLLALPAPGARVILASDGLWDAKTTFKGVASLARGKAPTKAAEELKRKALKDVGKRDDISIIIADVDLSPDVRGAPPSRKAAKEAGGGHFKAVAAEEVRAWWPLRSGRAAAPLAPGLAAALPRSATPPAPPLRARSASDSQPGSPASSAPDSQPGSPSTPPAQPRWEQRSVSESSTARATGRMDPDPPPRPPLCVSRFQPQPAASIAREEPLPPRLLRVRTGREAEALHTAAAPPAPAPPAGDGAGKSARSGMLRRGLHLAAAAAVVGVLLAAGLVLRLPEEEGVLLPAPARPAPAAAPLDPFQVMSKRGGKFAAMSNAVASGVAGTDWRTAAAVCVVAVLAWRAELVWAAAQLARAVCPAGARAEAALGEAEAWAWAAWERRAAPACAAPCPPLPIPLLTIDPQEPEGGSSTPTRRKKKGKKAGGRGDSPRAAAKKPSPSRDRPSEDAPDEPATCRPIALDDLDLSEPVVIRGLVDDMGVAGKWTPEFFAGPPMGDMEIDYFTDARKPHAVVPDARDKLKKVIQKVLDGGTEKFGTEMIFRRNKWLMREVEVGALEGLFGAGHFKEERLGRMLTVPVFFAQGMEGQATSRTDLHAEPIANVCLQLTGSKKWTLLRPVQSGLLRPRLSPDGRAYFYSARDPHDAALQCMERYEVEVRAGEVLWVPPWTWHRVDYLPGVPALSVSLFHVRLPALVTANPLFTLLAIPNMIKELLGWKKQ